LFSENKNQKMALASLLSDSIFFNESGFYGTHEKDPYVEDLDDKYVLEFEFPGFKKEDINIKIDKSRLLIQGHRKNEKRERKYYNSFLIPKDCQTDESACKASMDLGILTITILKRKQEPSHLEMKSIPIA
jgi:HSP20 family molecular chaperone IbpA